jgi:hypothetical protein
MKCAKITKYGPLNINFIFSPRDSSCLNSGDSLSHNNFLGKIQEIAKLTNPLYVYILVREEGDILVSWACNVNHIPRYIHSERKKCGVPYLSR